MYPIIYFSNNQKFAYKIAFKPVCNLTMFCLKIFNNIDYKIENLDILKDNIKNGPIIIGCNHQSAWETFIFAKLFDKLSIVIKKELLNVPIAGIYFKKLGCIAIDRSSSIKSIKDLMKYGKISSEKNVSILIFPNGTRSEYGEDVEYKSGLYAMYKYLNIPILPAKVDSGKFWPRRSFKKNPGTITMSFKNLIHPGLSKEDFMQTFENEMQ